LPVDLPGSPTLSPSHGDCTKGPLSAAAVFVHLERGQVGRGIKDDEPRGRLRTPVVPLLTHVGGPVTTLCHTRWIAPERSKSEKRMVVKIF
jgi:hypothetical protein